MDFLKSVAINISVIFLMTIVMALFLFVFVLFAFPIGYGFGIAKMSQEGLPPGYFLAYLIPIGVIVGYIFVVRAIITSSLLRRYKTWGRSLLYAVVFPATFLGLIFLMNR